MAAGQGFKTFTTGEVLTAADVNGYLMQGVNVFANATERDAEITSPQEGQFAYLKDTNVTTYYTGSAWANLDTTGMTNPMTTTGDTIYSSSGSTPARLGIGSTGQVLTVSGGLPVWATPGGAGANWSLLNSGGTALSGSTTTVSGISGQDKLMILVDVASTSVADAFISFRLNGDTGSNYRVIGSEMAFASTYNSANFGVKNTTTSLVDLARMANSSGESVSAYAFLSGCNSSGVKAFNSLGAGSGGSGQRVYDVAGYYNSSSTISSVSIVTSAGTFDNGTVFIYGSA
jgi:hypothetical protein